MPFYQCSGTQIYVNIDLVKIFHIEKSMDGKHFSVYADLLGEDGFYSLETFDNLEEAEKCIKYILDDKE
jgi:hypothetical protein